MIIYDKYSPDLGRWNTKQCKKTHGCTYWKGIMTCKETFDRYVSILVGNEARTCFWNDRWLCDESLRSMYPSVFEAMRSKNLLLSQIVEIHDGRCAWNLNPRRRLTDIEIAQVAELSKKLDRVCLNDDEDIRVWEKDLNPFSANRVLKLLTSQRSIAGQFFLNNFPADRIWRVVAVPPKVGFFMWTLVRGRVLTVENLIKRGLHIVNRCVLCQAMDESVEHLFNNCNVTKEIWAFFGGAFKVNFLTASDIAGKLSMKPDAGLTRVGRKYWETCIHAVTWGIWMERNSRIFEGKNRTAAQIISDIKRLIWDWNILSIEGRSIKCDQIMFNWNTLLR